MSESEEPAERPEVKFTYTKSPLFRTIKADGIWGTLSPRGDIIMSLFNERIPVPDTETYVLKENGGLKLKDQKRSTIGLLREVEVAVHLDPLVAVTMANWLLAKIRMAEEQMGVKFSTTPDGDIKITQVADDGSDNEITSTIPIPITE